MRNFGTDDIFTIRNYIIHWSLLVRRLLERLVKQLGHPELLVLHLTELLLHILDLLLHFSDSRDHHALVFLALLNHFGVHH